MAPDYDLSYYSTCEVDLWLHLYVDAIIGQIMANQAERLDFPLTVRERIVPSLAGNSRAIFNGG